MKVNQSFISPLRQRNKCQSHNLHKKNIFPILYEITNLFITEVVECLTQLSDYVKKKHPFVGRETSTENSGKSTSYIKIVYDKTMICN